MKLLDIIKIILKNYCIFLINYFIKRSMKKGILDKTMYLFFHRSQMQMQCILQVSCLFAKDKSY